MGLKWVGKQEWRERLRTDCCIPELRVYRSVGNGQFLLLLRLPKPVGFFPTVGPCYTAPPTAPLYTPVLSFQEKENLLF